MKDNSNLNKILSKVLSFIPLIISNKWVRLLLLVVSMLYSLLLTFFSWSEIKKIDFPSLIFTILICFVIYLTSVIVQFANWSILLNKSIDKLWRNIDTYFNTILMRRLPGGIWHWVGRYSLHENTLSITKKHVMLANLYEWIILVSTGFLCFFVMTGNYLYGAAIAILVFFSVFRFLSKSSFRGASHIAITSGIIILYLCTWIFGSIIFYLFGINIHALSTVPFTNYISVWSLSGSISSVFIFLPSGLGIRELSFASLLQQYSLPAVLFLGLEIRIFFLIFDLLIGFGYIIARRFIKKYFSRLTQSTKAN